MFTINLIRTRRMNQQKRAMIYFGMMSYIFICGVILIMFGYSTTLSYMDTQGLRAKVRSLEKKYGGLRSATYKDISAYTKEIRADLNVQLYALRTIDSVQKRRIPISELIRRFSYDLPEEAYISTFELNQEDQQLEFDIILPVAAAGDKINATKLVSVWKQDEVIMEVIDNVRTSITRREEFGKKEVYISHFIAKLKKN